MDNDLQKGLSEMERDELELYAYTISREQDRLHDLLRLIPPCPSHGGLCTVHAEQWVLEQIEKETFNHVQETK
jgi:hypothetical protein